MTIARTKTWAFAEKLTADQINAVDANVTHALDKRAGQTDTLASAVTVTGATTFSGTTAVNGAMTVTAPIVTSNTITTTSGIVFGSGNTVTGNMHLAGTQTVDSGGLITVASGGAFTLQAGSTNTFTGATITGGTFASPTLSGTMTGGFIHNMDLTMTTGHVMNLDTGSVIQRAGNNVLWLVGTAVSAMTTSISSFTSTSYVDINATPGTGCCVSLSCVAGDILIVNGSMGVFNSTNQTTVKLCVSDPGVGAGATVIDLPSPRTVGTNVVSAVACESVYTVVGTGTVKVYGRVVVLGGTATVYGTDVAGGAATIRVLQYRP